MFQVYNNMAPETLKKYFQTMPKKLANDNSFVRCPMYCVFNGTETLSFQRLKICDTIINMYNHTKPSAFKCKRYRVY